MILNHFLLHNFIEPISGIQSTFNIKKEITKKKKYQETKHANKKTKKPTLITIH